MQFKLGLFFYLTISIILFNELHSFPLYIRSFNNFVFIKKCLNHFISLFRYNYSYYFFVQLNIPYIDILLNKLRLLINLVFNLLYNFIIIIIFFNITFLLIDFQKTFFYIFVIIKKIFFISCLMTK